jgi:hypothetical protein
VRSILHRTPSVSLVVALVALFVALGGGAYAATNTLMGHNQLAPNSVWRNNIGKNAAHINNLSSSLKVARQDRQDRGHGRNGTTRRCRASGTRWHQWRRRSRWHR